MYSSIDTFITASFFSATLAAAQSLSSIIAPLVGLCYTLYLMLICLNFIRGAETNFVSDILYRVFILIFFLTIGLSYTKYSTIVVPIITEAFTSFSLGFTGSATSYPALLDSTYGLITTYVGASKLASISTFSGVLQSLIPLSSFMLDLKSILLLVSVLIFTIPCFLIITIAKFIIYSCIAVGPLFFALLVFPATRQYFSAWLNTVFGAIILALLVGIFTKIATDNINGVIVPGVYLYDVPFSDILAITARLLILTFLLKFVPSLASSLSAGGLNIGGVGGLGSALSGAAAKITGASRLKQSLTSFGGSKTPKTPKAGGTIEGTKPKLPG